jgi:hypothetical protein
MLSKMFMRGAVHLKSSNVSHQYKLLQTPLRHFRSDFVNPYKASPVELSEVESNKQEQLPVWERLFDYKKYMEHDGPLKVITNIH